MSEGARTSDRPQSVRDAICDAATLRLFWRDHLIHVPAAYEYVDGRGHTFPAEAARAALEAVPALREARP